MRSKMKLLCSIVISFFLCSCLPGYNTKYISNPPDQSIVLSTLENYPHNSGFQTSTYPKIGSDVKRISISTPDSKEEILMYYSKILTSLGFVEVSKFNAFDANAYFHLNACPTQGAAILVDEKQGIITIEHSVAPCI